MLCAWFTQGFQWKTKMTSIRKCLVALNLATETLLLTLTASASLSDFITDERLAAV